MSNWLRDPFWKASGVLFPATVVSVDRVRKFLVVRDEECIEYPDVRLTAVLQETERLSEKSIIFVFQL